MSALPSGLEAVLDLRDPTAALGAFRQRLAGRIVFTTSFGVEDQAITHMILHAGLDVDMVTLDTGRLFPETYEVWAATERRYGMRIRAIFPDTGRLESLLARQGVDGFRDSVDARKACCHARKVEPLTRALAGAKGWITGLRADQSLARAAVQRVSWDEGFGLVKLNPLLNWSRDDAVDFTSAHQVPVNALHARGFLSIGCAPCTRAVQPGEPERAGRWWWEDEARKECGLHVGPDGRVTRALSEASP